MIEVLELGFDSKQTGWATVQTAVQQMVTDGVRELRLFQVHRLQDLLASVWSNAIDPEADRPAWA